MAESSFRTFAGLIYPTGGEQMAALLTITSPLWVPDRNPRRPSRLAPSRITSPQQVPAPARRRRESLPEAARTGKPTQEPVDLRL